MLEVTRQDVCRVRGAPPGNEDVNSALARQTLSMQAASSEDLSCIATDHQANRGARKSAMGSSVGVQFSESELHSRSDDSL
jgi:hypothetical protein